MRNREQIKKIFTKKQVGETIILFPFILLGCFLLCLSTTGFISIGHKIDIDYMRLFYVALLCALFRVIITLNLNSKNSWIFLCLVSAGTGFLLYSLHSNKELIVFASILLFINLLFSFISTKKEGSSLNKRLDFITSIISTFAAAYALASLIFPTVSFGTVSGYHILSELLVFIGFPIGFSLLVMLFSCVFCCANIAPNLFVPQPEGLSREESYQPASREEPEATVSAFSGKGYTLGSQ